MHRLRVGLDIIGGFCLLAAGLALGGHYFVPDIILQGALLATVFGAIKFGFLALMLARIVDIIRFATSDSHSARQRVAAIEDRRSSSTLKF